MSSDGIDEVIEGQLRVMLTTAAQIAERRARQREAELRRAEARSAREARELEARFEAERRAVHAELANVHRESWWDLATESQIVHAWEIAKAWGAEDPEAARAQERIREGVKARYGITREQLDADALKGRIVAAEERVQAAQTRSSDPELSDGERSRALEELREAETLLAALKEDQRAIAATTSSRDERIKSREEKAEARAMLEQADHDAARAEEARVTAEQAPGLEEDRFHQIVEAEQLHHDAAQAEQEGHRVWDSAERREATAEELRAKGIDAETVATRMRADVAQGKPATEAVKGSAGRRPPTARKTRVRAKKRPELGR